MQATFADLTQEQHVQKLHSLLKEHILRRMKKDVLTQLPAKREQIVRVELSSQQRDFYKKILIKQFPVLKQHAGKGSSSSVHLKNIVMELRKCCNHPILFDERDNALEVTDLTSLIESSGKLQLLDRMMPLMKERVWLCRLHASLSW
jgi:chromodomain-helicase-DNA-binding protein 4